MRGTNVPVCAFAGLPAGADRRGLLAPVVPILPQIVSSLLQLVTLPVPFSFQSGQLDVPQ